MPSTKWSKHMQNSAPLQDIWLITNNNHSTIVVLITYWLLWHKKCNRVGGVKTRMYASALSCLSIKLMRPTFRFKQRCMQQLKTCNLRLNWSRRLKETRTSKKNALGILKSSCSVHAALSGFQCKLKLFSLQLVFCLWMKWLGVLFSGEVTAAMPSCWFWLPATSPGPTLLQHSGGKFLEKCYS